jgi:hypothetical protein
MRIGGIGPAIGPAARRAASERREPEGAETQTRALIAVQATATSARAVPLTRHPAAPFLAHLIATRIQAPQTRVRRRAEPKEALAAYRATMKAPAARRRFGKCA